MKLIKCFNEALAQICKKYWVGKPKYWDKNLVKSDKCKGISQLLVGMCPGFPPRVYTYAMKRLIIVLCVQDV